MFGVVGLLEFLELLHNQCSESMLEEVDKVGAMAGTMIQCKLL